MKIKKIKFILTIMLISIVSAFSRVYAKTSIAIKPNSPVYTNRTISDFYEECMKMKDPGESLEGANVDVHMATNKDWAVVVYFANSAYGVSGAGENVGITTTINGKSYKSTNGNATGVMNFGATTTYTAGVSNIYTEVLDSSEVYQNGKKIIENAEDDIHVDVFAAKTNMQQAFTKWEYSTFVGSDVDAPFCSRTGWFGYYAGMGGGSAPRCDGRATNYTFRPAIWN